MILDFFVGSCFGASAMYLYNYHRSNLAIKRCKHCGKLFNADFCSVLCADYDYFKFSRDN